MTSNILLKNKEKIKQIFIYVFFGILTTLVSFGSFYILRKIFYNINESILNTVSIIASIIFAYFTNRKFVFKSKEKNIIKEFLKFLSSRSFSAILEVVLFFILNTLLFIEGLISKALISLFVIILNYITSKIIVFKNK